MPTHEQGIKVLGTPFGHEDFVAAHLESVLAEHHTFISRIPEVKDVQSAWLLLLHCASARACHLTRVVRPSAVGDFTETHDKTLWQCLSDILKVDPLQCDEVVGGLGLRNSGRMRVPAFWASWADCLPMMHKRYPQIAVEFRELEACLTLQLWLKRPWQRETSME